MGGGAWWAAICGVSRSQTRLSDFTLTFHFHALEKEMATHSSVLAWRIPGMGEPGGLLSMGSHRVGHNWSDLAVAVATKTFFFFNFFIVRYFIILCWFLPYNHMNQPQVYICPLSLEPTSHLTHILPFRLSQGTGMSSLCHTADSHWLTILHGKIPWRREWQPIPVSLPGESHGQRSLSIELYRVKHDWSNLAQHNTSVLHIEIYIFPCYSLHSFHPLPPPLCPQVCSLCLHLRCCPANRFKGTIYLDSIHIH